MTAAQDTLYDILEVSPNATLAQIEQSYERLMSFLAPDSMALYAMLEDEDLVDDHRQRVEAAYEVLSDPNRRAGYDERLMDQDGLPYPDLLVPETSGGTSLSYGHMGTPDDPPATDVSAMEPSMMGVPGMDTPGMDGPVPEARREASVEDRPMPQSSAESPVLTPEVTAPPEPPPPVAVKAARPRRPTVGAATEKGRRRFTIGIEPPEFGAGSELSGELLAELRQSADATLKELATVTKIGKRYLQAIEDNDYASLPARVYTRGFVNEYARALGLDAQQVTAAYMQRYDRVARGEGDS